MRFKQGLVASSLVLYACLLLQSGCESKAPSFSISPKSSQSTSQTVLPPVNDEPANEPSLESLTVVDSQTEAPVGDSVSRVTSKDAVKFAEEWVAAVTSGEFETFEPLFDWKSAIDRGVDGIAMSSKELANLRKSNLSNRLAKQTFDSIDQFVKLGGSYRAVRVTYRGDETHVLLRLLSVDGELNFHDIRLNLQSTKIIADRFFIALTGEELADSIRNSLTALNRNNNIMGQITGLKRASIEDLKVISEMVQLMRTGNKSEVPSKFDQLSLEGKKLKLALLYRCLSIDHNDEVKYLAALDDYAKEFPNDPSLGLIRVDAAVIRKDAKLLEESRRSLQEWTGGDPYIDLLNAGCLASFGKLNEAKQMIDKVDVDGLELAYAHQIKLSYSLIANDFRDVRIQLETLRDKYGYVFENLSNEPDYKGFVASEEYQKWTDGQPANLNATTDP